MQYNIILGFMTLLLCAFTSTAYAAELKLNIYDQNGEPVSNAVVYLLTEDGKNIPSSKKGTTITVDQVNERFSPHVSVSHKSDTLRFRNSDSTSHHIYSFSKTKPLNFVVKKGELTDDFALENTGVITLGCNIHDHMLGFIYVVDTPHYSVTQKDGSAVLQNINQNNYQIRIWHPRQKNALNKDNIIKVQSEQVKKSIEISLKYDKRRDNKRRQGRGRY